MMLLIPFVVRSIYWSWRSATIGSITFSDVNMIMYEIIHPFYSSLLDEHRFLRGNMPLTFLHVRGCFGSMPRRRCFTLKSFCFTLHRVGNALNKITQFKKWTCLPEPLLKTRCLQLTKSKFKRSIGKLVAGGSHVGLTRLVNCNSVRPTLILV